MTDTKSKEPASDETLEKVVALLGALLTKDAESLVEKVKMLEPLGLSAAEVARATGSSAATVRKTQSRAKKG